MVPCKSVAHEVSYDRHTIEFPSQTQMLELHLLFPGSESESDRVLKYRNCQFPTCVLFFLKLLQIVANFRNGHTGQLSFIMVLMLFLGAMARIFTTIQETGDKVMLVTFLVSTTLNATLVFQVLYYWNVKPDLKKKTA